MKPFSKITVAFVAVSAVLFMAGTTLLPAAGLGGLVRDVLMLGVCGVILYGLLTIQAARRDVSPMPVVEAEPEPEPKILFEAPAPSEPQPVLRRAA